MAIRTVPISQSFAASSIGLKLATDAHEILEGRKEVAGPLDDELTNLVDVTITKDNLSELNLEFVSYHFSHSLHTTHYLVCLLLY